MLKETIKKQLLDQADEIDIDVSELESRKYINNIYGVESHLAVSGYDYDEDEYWRKQLLKLASWIEYDGLCEYVDLADGEDVNGELTLEAVRWLRDLGEE